MMQKKPVELLIIGAGSRGSIYSSYALTHPDQAGVVGVADPRAFYRSRLAEKHQPAPKLVVEDWRELAAQPKMADAVIIATPDVGHAEPAIAFARLGYAILLEKPMAPDEESCRQIVAAVTEHNNLFAVCHVLRYTAYTQQLKKLVDSGLIGDILSINHVEPVGYWHYAHSYVRGNWRNEALSSFMLLAKSCHDIDWLRYMIGRPCVQVSSFGSLQHFTRANKPVKAGDATRCTDCNAEEECPYSAQRFYLAHQATGRVGWPLDVISTDYSREGVLTALREGPYGRCVYESDNDVVDHQVVNLLYDNGATASFTMIATSESRDRQTTIFGSRGELRGNGKSIEHIDFLTNSKQEIEIPRLDGPMSAHGGGDYGIMQHFIQAVAHNDPGIIRSGPLESLETHSTVFAAERARRTNSVVRIV